MKIKTIIKMADVLDDTRKMPCDMHDLDNHYYPSESQGTLIKLAEMDIVHLVRAFKKGVNKSLNHTTDAELSTQNDDLVNANKNLGDRVDYLTKGIQDGFISGVDDLEKIEQLEKDKQRLSDRIDVILKENEKVHLDKQSLMNQLEQEVRIDTQEGKCADLTKVNAELRFQIEQVDRNQTVSKEAYDIAWDNNKLLKKELALMMLKYHELFDSRNTEVTEKVWQKKYDELNVKYIHNCVWQERYEAELKNAEYWKREYNNVSIKGHGYVFCEIPNDTDGQEFVDMMKQYFNKKSYKMRVRGQHVKPELRGTGVTSHGQNIDESTHLRVYIDVK